MTLERFSERMRQHLGREGVSHRVGMAAINDLLRALHELIVKTNRDHRVLFSQVEFALGTAAATNLMRLLGQRPAGGRNTITSHQDHLKSAIDTICAQRGIEEREGHGIFREFLAAFDQERFDEDGSEESTVWFLYFGVRDEAAFHFCGLFTGDDLGMCCEMQDRMDWRLRRFGAFVQMWELEKKWDDEEAALEAKDSEGMDCAEANPSGPREVEDRRSEADDRRAKQVEHEIVEAAIKSLIGMPNDCRLSGEDSSLASGWEEICFQVQVEHSFFWDAYVETMRSFLAGLLEERPVDERQLILPDGSDDEILEVLMSDLLTRAADYESENIARGSCWRPEDEDWES